MENSLYYLLKGVGRRTLSVVLLLLVTFFSSTAADTGSLLPDLQKSKVTVSLARASLQEFIKTVETQTPFRFTFDEKDLPGGKQITINAKNEPLSKVLKRVTAETGLEFKLINNNIHIRIPQATELQSATPSAVRVQTQPTVTGTVTDEKGEGLPGVTVLIQGTTTGTATGVDGSYSLNVPDGNGTLVFSFIGYQTQEVPLNDRAIVNVSLSVDSKALEEVVVVGYGTQKKTTVTGSVVTTSGAELSKAPEPNIANTLIGRLPGITANNTSGEPGYENTEILIRGRSTFGNNSPLIVIDGVPDRAGGFSHIDANDIESVTVLKDASAAIYGSRAANGVILVTTKRGKVGKPTVTYTANYALRQPTTLPEMLNSADYAIALNEIETSIYGRSPLYTEEQIQWFRDGSDPVSYPNANYMDGILRKFAPQTQHNLSIRGGSEAVRYFVSAGYQFQDNYYINSNSNYNQFNLRSNVDVQASENLNLFANVSLRQENRNSPHYTSETIWRFLYKGDPRVNYQWPENGLQALPYQEDFNPLTAADGTMGYRKNQSLHANLDLGFKLDLPSLTEGLSLNGGVYADVTNGFYKHFQQAFSLYGRDNNTGEYYAQHFGPNNAALDENMTQWKSYTANIKLNYDRTFGNKHFVSGFVAYEQNETRNDYLAARRQDFVSTSIDELFAGERTGQTNDGNAAETGRINYFGRLDYSFSERYLFQFNWRYDGSQNFPKENRFGFFPGVSIGWVLSEESYWKENIDFINFLKVRGSWGQMGNDRIAQYQFLSTYTFDNPATFGGANPLPQTGLTQLRVANPNVTWEVATTTNIGVEGRMLNNSINFEVDVFKRKTENILATGSSYVPGYTGLTLPAENIGEVEGHGFEAILGYTKEIGKFVLSASGNMSYARNKITYFDEPETTLEWQKQTGKPIGANWLLYESIGIFRTQEDLDNYPRLSNSQLGDLIFRDVNEDGKIDGNDRVRPEKTSTPEIIYGVNLGLAFKQWDLSMLWQGADNVWQYVFWESGGIGNFTQDYFDNRWTPENINSDGPRIYDREATVIGQKNTYFLRDASYFRLKNIQLGYTLPESIVQRLPLNGLRVFVSASNLLTFTSFKDIDPETPEDPQGYAGRSTPQSRVFNAGLNLTF